MSAVDDQTGQRTRWRNRRHRMRLECRECDVICERVVYPWHCLKSNCEYVYAYEDDDTVYFGCLGKVFAAEFDLAVFSEGLEVAEQNRQDAGARGSTTKGRLARRGQRRRRVKTTDPYGAVRLAHAPRPQCFVKIEQAYDPSTIGSQCCNPTFFHEKSGTGDDSIRLTAPPPGERDVPLG